MNLDIYTIIFFFFFNDTATTEIYTLSLHDALPIYTGDWKIDPTPYLGNTTSEATFRALGDEGVLALVCDSTKDRKSTRLNSSHANISYAVFCLKKKKKHNYTPLPEEYTTLTYNSLI